MYFLLSTKRPSKQLPNFETDYATLTYNGAYCEPLPARVYLRACKSHFISQRFMFSCQKCVCSMRWSFFRLLSNSKRTNGNNMEKRIDVGGLFTAINMYALLIPHLFQSTCCRKRLRNFESDYVNFEIVVLINKLSFSVCIQRPASTYPVLFVYAKYRHNNCCRN